MPHVAATVNPEGFFDAFGGGILFRAVNHLTQEAKSFYGEAWLHLPELERLNADGYSIYFCVNDPHGLSAKTESFTELRCIWQDAEPGKTANPASEPVIAGQEAHFTVETSPGRFQRFWLCEPLPVAHWQVIHTKMVEWHGHDHECATGPAQIMRAPGFLNTKYDPAPLARIVNDRSHLPKLMRAAVEKHFGIGETVPLRNAANAHQRMGGPNAEPNNVTDLDKERSKRGQTINRAHSAERKRDQIRETPAGTLDLERILETLALLNPSMGRNEWRKVGGALHFMFQGSDIGFDIFETWSAGGDNFKGGMDCETLWSGLRLDHPTPTHWLTLVNMAARIKPDKACQARLRSPGFDRLRQTHDAYLEYQPLVIHYEELKRGPAGFEHENERDSKINTHCHYRDQGISVRFDDFAGTTRLNGEKLSNAMIVDQWSVAYDQGWRPSQRQLHEHTIALARDGIYNPAQEYFAKLAGRWDGRERLSSMFQRLLGAPDTQSIRELGPLLMYAAVRRVFNPGFKFDLMPILAGKQELGKSSLFRLLCPDEEWFLNSLRLDLEEKRLYAQIQGKLFVEFGELSGKKSAEVEKIKAFVTQQTDEYVANYATEVTRRNRIAVFVGTTNEHRFLRDLTGNRRFPVIPVGRELDWDKVAAEKEQLWAEAVTMEELTFDLRLSPEGKADMERLQQDRIDRDVTVETIFEDLNRFAEGFVHRNALWAALGFLGKDREKKLSATARYALNDLEKMLRHNGWTINEVSRHDGGQDRGHFRKKQRGLIKEIVYYGSGFTYKSDIKEEADDLLD